MPTYKRLTGWYVGLYLCFSAICYLCVKDRHSSPSPSPSLRLLSHSALYAVEQNLSVSFKPQADALQQPSEPRQTINKPAASNTIPENQTYPVTHFDKPSKKLREHNNIMGTPHAATSHHTKLTPQEDENGSNILNKTASFRPGKIHFFSYADHFEPPVCLLSAALNRYGYRLNMLAWQRSTQFRSGERCSHAACRPSQFAQLYERKVFWQNDLLQNHEKYGIGQDDLVVFMDAFDVLMVNDPSRLVDRFLHQTNQSRGVVFNGEPTCGDGFLRSDEYGEMLRRKTFQVQLTENHAPRTISGNGACPMMAAKSLLKSQTRGPFFGLNSGLFVGDAASLKALFSKIMDMRESLDFDHQGDQILFQLVYLKYPSLNIVVDTDASIFYTFSYFHRPGDMEHVTETQCTSSFLNNGNPVRVRIEHETEPLFLHFPGNYKHLFPTCSRQKRLAILEHLREPTFMDFDRNMVVHMPRGCPGV